MPKRTKSYRTALLEDLQNPAEAASYLNAALDDSSDMFLRALRDVAEARQVAKVAEAAGVARESVYRMLASTGNPTFANLTAILKAVGLKLEIVAECTNAEVLKGAQETGGTTDVPSQLNIDYVTQTSVPAPRISELVRMIPDLPVGGGLSSLSGGEQGIGAVAPPEWLADNVVFINRSRKKDLPSAPVGNQQRRRKVK